MTSTAIVGLTAALLAKHFVFDFYYQPPYMWKNKGSFGHLGGIVHSGLHAASTAVILALFGVQAALVVFLAMGEFILHYFIDFAKMNINRIKGWTATTHEQFWQLTGFDQLLHQLTYVLIICFVI